MESLLAYIHRIEETEHILKYAARLAEDLNCKIDLLYSVELQNFPMGVPTMARQAEYYNEQQLRKLFEEVKKTFEKEVNVVKSKLKNPPEINYQVKQGISAHVVDDFTDKGKYKYLLLSADEDNSFLINDRNQDIIKHAHCPVWIVPSNRDYKKVESIIYATDYNEEDIDTMKKISDLATVFDAKITGLHVTDNLDFNEKVKNSGFRDMITDKVGYKKLDITTIVQEKGDSLAKTINGFAEMVDGDMIAVLKENKNFFERLFTKSETKDIISHTHYPLLVFQEKE